MNLFHKLSTESRPPYYAPQQETDGLCSSRCGLIADYRDQLAVAQKVFEEEDLAIRNHRYQSCDSALLLAERREGEPGSVYSLFDLFSSRIGDINAVLPSHQSALFPQFLRTEKLYLEVIVLFAATSPSSSLAKEALLTSFFL